MNIKEEINIVWLKRDLRLQDNEAIFNALSSEKRILLLYVFENSLIEDVHYSERHWNFIKQSLVDMNDDLAAFNTKILTVNTEVVTAFNQLQNFYTINTVFSHQETGLLITYNRDKEFVRYCRNNSIHWIENINNGVLRGLLNREDWFESWEDYMNAPQIINEYQSEKLVTIDEIKKLENTFHTANLNTSINKIFQKGGTKTGWKYANSFFEERHKEYMFNISKPALSRKSTSRLSPYIAWGNLSIRQVFQKAHDLKTESNKRHLSAFISRLRWQAHFIQKFEMEHTMENASINKGYHKLKKSISAEYKTAWIEGKTGFPLVDASMRCLNETGFLNFRMRSLLVSFFTHILWQPWQEATHHLSQMFLDFEPGIHFPQLQMQAAETGINNIRIYNPVKNSLEHDEDATFIKEWVPELKNLPLPFIHEPYLMTTLDQQFNNFELGVDYPLPIVNAASARKKAAEILWNLRNNKEVMNENRRILIKHTLTDRTRMLKNE
ncbi:MAG: deoxyribodipyrimidine photolyase [Flavobacteriia bacterium]|nr:deoxyribodipyrimidine photolyase [Flavobacteriia bacterium]OIP46200.1 MAG: deoxyribodipyrimidine photolyase [Flavobacteriaceae bacterium CG2_30_31_66]PIV96853.1 MAG: deoxyribodipyrimidine photolyase [Flavobacteriaceae bacterium CG17_big_fil_post_rev_8_21_14_2_50_31_13]PIX14674.1 MAG: deoxyribodipyrimidine photolyase [Flavobacteriaceae bacterium CG_4_8_14_3_um_filter_31_8]PIY15685.1 MAG: deoxyribodipyrimidine photolyase [Flavobacteriaceae bacterium CG_4_10_14_3_um_filter_31_253]PIZ09526.1 MA